MVGVPPGQSGSSARRSMYAAITASQGIRPEREDSADADVFLVTLDPGTTVTFVNDDEEPHNVTAADHSYRSPLLPPGARYTHQYAAPGDYPYFCALHPHMTGHIVVVTRSR